MVNLPADFVAETRRIMGDERYNRFVGAFDEEAPTSIRVNPRIAIDHGPLTILALQASRAGADHCNRLCRFACRRTLNITQDVGDEHRGGLLYVVAAGME